MASLLQRHGTSTVTAGGPMSPRRRGSGNRMMGLGDPTLFMINLLAHTDRSQTAYNKTGGFTGRNVTLRYMTSSATCAVYIHV